ncbi:MAG: hypothetical protein NTZ65_00115 [Candidatus Berkelbacteria bacterium]|nr:hypothetical protein [Candidatus Berkelbacteria bacterium]
MKKYLKYFLTNFHEEATYKADFIFYIGSEVVFFVVFYFIWTNVYAKGGVTDISTFSLSATITYYFLTSLLFRLNPKQAIYLNRSIWNGELTNEISKPYSVTLIYIVSSLSLMALEMIAYLPFAAIILIFVSKYIIFASVVNLLLFLASAVLASLLGITLYLFLHSLCFHFGDQDANLTLIDYLISFLGGALFPLRFLPVNLYQAFSYLPFKFLFDFPANVYLGKVSSSDLRIGFTEAFLWILIFSALYYFSFQSGLKKYAAVGR